MSEPDPEKVKREEERLMRAMSRQKQTMPVFGKQVSTDTMKRQREEEERKKKEQEQKIARQREELERKRLEAEKREAEKRKEVELAAQRAVPTPSVADPRPPAVEPTLLEPDQNALAKEERRLKRIASASSNFSKPEVSQQAAPASSLQAHLRLLQEKQQKIDDEKTSVVRPTPTPAPALAPAPAPAPAPAVISPRAVSPAAISPRAAVPEKIVSPRGGPPPIVSPRPNQIKGVETAKPDDSHFPPPGPPSIGGPFEVQVLDELNEVRRNPHKYADYLRTLASSYDALVFAVPGTRFVR
jgi:hypothetical protein